MKKFISLFVLIFFACGVFAQDAKLSIESAIDFALKNNPNIISAQKTMQSLQYNANAAKGKYLPKIDISALAVKIDDPVTLDLNNIRTAIIGASAASYSASGGTNAGQFKSNLESQIPSFEKELLDDTFVRVVATIVQPIFTGFKISANSAAKKLEQTVGETNFQNAKDKVIASVVDDYYRAKFIEQVISIRKDLQDNIANHVANAERLFDNGMISKANLLRVEVAHAEAEKDYHISLTDKELAHMLLSNTIGIRTENLELSSPMEMMKNTEGADYYIDKAYTENTSLKLLDAKKMMLKQKYKASTGKMLPTVAAFGEYQILNNKMTLIEPEWAVGISASINIFDGLSDLNEIKAVKAEIAALDAQIDDVKNLVATAVKKFYHQCKTAKKEYDALASSRDLAEENLKLYQSSFKEGLATSVEVVDAELALTKIKIEQAKAVWNYNTAYANLLNICALSEKELAPKSGEEK